MKKRKVTYPPAKTATRQPRGTGPASDTPYIRSTVAEINVNALNGLQRRPGLRRMQMERDNVAERGRGGCGVHSIYGRSLTQRRQGANP